MSDDKLTFPLPVEKDTDNNTIRLFPAAETDPSELYLYVPEDAECVICHMLKCGADHPFLVLATTDGQVAQVYCGPRCVLAHLSAALQPGYAAPASS